MSKINLNIQPQASIYALFSRLSYQEWFAIAEFVDNSTASYYLHARELEESHFDKLVVEINYDPVSDTIVIEDNAFGMEIEDFKRAILLDSKPIIVGRNEFGYGLKTAATWFGNHWSVESTQLFSENCYSATIDIDDLVSSKKNDTDINISKSSANEHYTKITISKLNRKLSTKKIKDKIIDVLNSMYRRDLKTGKIEIIYNGKTLSFTDYPVLTYDDKYWKKDISISFDYEGRLYNAKGFVGILEPGGVEKTGFALFRNNRVIESNFKPELIFGSSKTVTQIALKLYGEIDMDEFDVNQAKDGFSWNSELQEKFIENLKLAIPEYIEMAKLSKKERQERLDAKKKTEDKYQPDNAETRDEPKNNGINNNDTKPISDPGDINKPNAITLTEPEITPNSAQDNTKNKDLLKPNNDNYETTLNHFSKEYKVIWTDEFTSKFFYNLDDQTLKINIKHDFISSIVGDCITNKKVISKILLAYVLAENASKLASSTTGYIQATMIHNKFNQILSEIK